MHSVQQSTYNHSIYRETPSICILEEPLPNNRLFVYFGNPSPLALLENHAGVTATSTRGYRSMRFLKTLAVDAYQTYPHIGSNVPGGILWKLPRANRVQALEASSQIGKTWRRQSCLGKASTSKQLKKFRVTTPSHPLITFTPLLQPLFRVSRFFHFYCFAQRPSGAKLQKNVQPIPVTFPRHAGLLANQTAASLEKLHFTLAFAQ